MVSSHHRGNEVTGRITTFDQFRDTIASYRLPRVLLAALELDLFTTIGDGTWTVPALAKKTRLSERGLSILCRNLAMSGLLQKKADSYRNSRLAGTALNAGHATYRGGYLDLIKSHWTDWLRLPESVRSGSPIDHAVPDSPDYRRRFTWAMHHRTLETAPAIAAQINLHGATTFLDLGGGPGTYAMAFLAANPKLRATVCDREAALEVAKVIAAAHPTGRRLSYLPLDFSKDSIPGTYDVIWYSNVLHIYSASDNLAIFRRAKAAMNPGGRLIIQDAFLRPDGLFPAEASLFSVSMLLFTESGDTYSAAETTSWLKKVGFQRIRPLKVKPEAEDWEDGILEASTPGSRPGTPVLRGRSRGSSKTR